MFVTLISSWCIAVVDFVMSFYWHPPIAFGYTANAIVALWKLFGCHNSIIDCSRKINNQWHLQRKLHWIVDGSIGLFQCCEKEINILSTLLLVFFPSFSLRRISDLAIEISVISSKICNQRNDIRENQNVSMIQFQLSIDIIQCIYCTANPNTIQKKTSTSINVL